MNKKTCCFTGHRDIPKWEVGILKIKIKKAIVNLIKEGVIYFGAGGARGFDTLAAEAVLELKNKYPDIKLILVLPCLNQTRGWNEKDIVKYNNIIHSADKIRVLSDNYYSGCMHARNRYMVNNSSYCISYCRQTNGGTAYTVDYAIKNGKKIIYL